MKRNIEVEGITLTGGAYHNGRYCSGWVNAKLSDGTTVYLGGDDVKGFNAAADVADSMGYSTTQYRTKLDNWVKTGKWESR